MRAFTASSLDPSERLTTMSLHRDAGGEQIDDGRHERREISGFSAGDEMAIDDHGSVRPEGPSIDEIILDARAARHADAAVDAGGDRDPAAVADRPLGAPVRSK